MELIEQKVISIANQILKTELDINSSMDDIESWDSLQHIQILFSIEDEFRINFSEAELVSMRSIRDIINIVKEYNGS
jgi:acyl carrier protein